MAVQEKEESRVEFLRTYGQLTAQKCMKAERLDYLLNGTNLSLGFPVYELFS